MNKLEICFLGGAGGNFISHLLYNLQNNDYNLHNDVHFHKSNRSKDIRLTHHPVDKCKYFTGNYKFNMYLNAVYKYNTFDHRQNILPEGEQLEIYSGASWFSLEFTTDYDICYDDIYLSPKKFISDCFRVFDEAGIEYIKDYKLAYQTLENFKRTCIDPNKDFMNEDSLYWIGWCLGIDRLLLKEIPIFEKKIQAQDYLHSRQQLYGDITTQFNMIYFDV